MEYYVNLTDDTISKLNGGIVPKGKITITENGSDIDVAQYATADVNVPSGGGGFESAVLTVVPNASAYLGGVFLVEVEGHTYIINTEYALTSGTTQEFDIPVVDGYGTVVAIFDAPAGAEVTITGDGIEVDSKTFSIYGNATITVGGGSPT